jgi:cation diffusion facilitator family transporter
VTSSPQPRTGPGQLTGEGESLLTVLLALGANAAVAVLKLIAGLITGSGAMLSEAAHSLGDCTTEIFLLTALRRSDQPADRRHPFGYGKLRYFWSLLAAGAIFILGGAFSAYEGVRTIVDHHNEEQSSPLVAYLVLIGAALLEGISLMQGVRQARAAAASSERSVGDYLRTPDDPTVKSVVLEDSAALIGLAIAGAGVALHHATGSAVWDGAASLAISVLLVGVAVTLTRTCADLLIGQQADLRLVRAISARIEEQDEVLDVVDVLSMQLGTDRVLFCARVDFIDTYTAGDLELACVRIVTDLTAEFPILAEVFIEPVPRTDPELRQRVRGRYGRDLAEPG